MGPFPASFCICVFRRILFLVLVGVPAAQSSEQLDPSSAVSFYVANLNLSQWFTVDVAFRTELAVQAEIFCSYSPEECNVNTNTGVSVDNVLYYTGFPMEVDNNLRVVVGISLSTDQVISSPAVIPQAQLMSIMLINQASLQTAAGSLIGTITLYSEEPAVSPSPTSVPTAPSLDVVIENAILIIVEQAPLIQWQEGNLEQLFRQAVAEVANDHCTSSPTECNIDNSETNRRRRRSEDSIFDESNTYIIPDYPRVVSNSQLEIAFAVTLPSSVTLMSGVTDYFIPQSTLLSLGLKLSPVLAELSGAYIIGMSAYKPTEVPTAPSIWSQVAIGIAVPSALLGLIVLASFMGLHFIWMRWKRRKDIYNVENYVDGVSKQVEIVNYRHLNGIWSPVQSAEEEEDDEGEDFNSQEESLEEEEWELSSSERYEEGEEHRSQESDVVLEYNEANFSTLISYTSY